MTTITLRNVKGSALSFTEVDNNFTNLNTDKIEGITSSVDSELALWSSTTGKVLKRADLTGIVKATSGVATTATAGTDYVAPGGALGTPSSGTLSNCTVDGTDSVGFRNAPVNSQSAAYTAVLADAGKVILHPSTDANARTFTIPANASVAYAVGTVLTFILHL